MAKIKTEISQNIEIMNIILFTSQYSKICENIIGTSPIADIDNEYTKEIWNYFSPFIKHSVYSKIESMVPKGFFFGRPMELMLSVDSLPDLKPKYKMSDFALSLCGGQGVVNELLELIRDFAVQTKFEKFFSIARGYYNDYINAINVHLNKYPFIEVMENFYGTSQNTYNFIVSNLLKGSFGIHFSNSNNKLDLFSVFAINTVCFNEEENEFNSGALSSNVIFHEFSHPIINPLTEKNKDLVEKYKIAYDKLKPYKKPYTGYGDWEESVNEHIIRAISIYLVRNHCNSYYADKHLEHNYNLGYRYIPYLIERLDYYERNRNIYETIDDFYSELIKVFAKNI